MLNEWLKVKNMSSEGRSLGFICQAMGGLKNVTPWRTADMTGQSGIGIGVLAAGTASNIPS